MSDLKIGDEITTVEQLDELPTGSVILTGTARVACKSWHSVNPTAGSDDWHETGDERITATAATEGKLS